jgi:hypothetical protein
MQGFIMAGGVLLVMILVKKKLGRDCGAIKDGMIAGQIVVMRI